MKKIDTVIFDWAGTTIDYGCFAPLVAFIDAFSAVGIEITVSEARKPMGIKKIDHVKAILDMPRVSSEWIKCHGVPPAHEDMEALYNKFETILFMKLGEHCTPLPGACETVSLLRKSGMKIGSTTGYTREMMNIAAAEADKLGYSPDSIITSTDVPRGRPFPYMVWQNAINLESPDLSCICKVGDTISDIQEGLNAGVWSVGVVIGSNEWALSEEETVNLSAANRDALVNRITRTFIDSGAHFVIREIAELPALIGTIDRRLARGEKPG
jgi:phosphonoacetaldehyde hydrolase